jgi:hypothetical protein
VFNPALVERWNGTAWTIQSTPRPAGTRPRVLFSVACTSPDLCTAVGYYVSNSKADLTLAEAWNGTTWQIQATPIPTGSTEGVLQAVSCASATACGATGSTSTPQATG